MARGAMRVLLIALIALPILTQAALAYEKCWPHSYVTTSWKETSYSGCKVTTWTVTQKYCQFCGSVYSTTNGTKTTTTVHTWVTSTDTEYTESNPNPCTTNVYAQTVTTRTCSVCGASGGTTRGSKTLVGTQTSHSYVTVGYDSKTTTRTSGCIIYGQDWSAAQQECENCGATKTAGWVKDGSEYVAGDNHSYRTTSSAKSSTSGCMTQTWTHYKSSCSKCGDVEDQWDSDKTTTYNHVWTTTATNEYTESHPDACTTLVYGTPVTTQVCSSCGAKGSVTRGTATQVGTQTSHAWAPSPISVESEIRSRQVGCTVFSQDWTRSLSQCERCGATDYSGWMPTGSEYISGYDHDMVAGASYPDVQEIRPSSGCLWTINTYTMTPHHCSRCGIAGSTTRSLSSTTREYRHTWVNSWGDTVLSYELRGCEQWCIEQQALYSTCSVCGEFQNQGYQKTGEWFRDYQHDFSVRLSSTPCEGPHMTVPGNACQQVYHTWDEVAYKCSRCAATTVKNENDQVHFVGDHDSVPWSTEYDGPREVQEGCSVYAITYFRTVYQCQNCGAETYSPWIEDGRTFVRESHDFSVRQSEKKEATGYPSSYLCDTSVPYKVTTTWKCSRCAATKTTEVTGVDHYYDHIWGEPYTATKQALSDDKATILYYARTEHKCIRCGLVEPLSDWETAGTVTIPTNDYLKPGETKGDGYYIAYWFLKTENKWVVFFAGNSAMLDQRFPFEDYFRTGLGPPEALNLLYRNGFEPTIDPQYNNDGTWYMMAPRNINQPPVASFAATSPVSVGHTVVYSDASYDQDGVIIARQWSGQKQASYTAPGDYTVYLVVQDDTGVWSNMAAFTIHVVANQAPIADFDCPATVQVGQTVTYVNKSYDPDGDRIVSSSWAGNLSKFTTVGTYAVTLRVQDEHGMWSDTCSKTIEVKPASANNPPSVSISPNPPIVYVGQQVTYSVVATDPDPDDQGLLTLSPDPSALPKSFSTVGEKTVSISVFDPDGASDTDSCIVTVIAAPEPPAPPPPPPADGSNHKPVASFTVSAPVYAGAAVTYHDMSYDPDAGDYITNWNWTGNLAVFAAPGTYPVTLVVTDNHGLISDPCALNIQVLAPTVTVTPDQPLVEGERGGLVTITVTTTGTVDTVVLALPPDFTRKVTLGDGTVLDYNPTGQMQMTQIGPDRWEGKFCIPWTQTQPPDGDYTVTVTAYAGGASASATVVTRVNGFVQVFVPIVK